MDSNIDQSIILNYSIVSPNNGSLQTEKRQMSILRLPIGDSSILSHIARFPNSTTVDELISKLKEDISREIALDIIGQNPNASHEVRKATEDFRNWSKKEEEKVYKKRQWRLKMRISRLSKTR